MKRTINPLLLLLLLFDYVAANGTVELVVFSEQPLITPVEETIRAMELRRQMSQVGCVFDFLETDDK